MISKAYWLCTCLLLIGCAPKPVPTISPAPSGDYHIAWLLGATPRSLDIVPVTVRLMDKQGQPISGALVFAELSMPSMPMPENKITLHPTQPGTYTGTVRFTMSGTWAATVTAAKNGTQARQTFSIAVK